MAYEQLAYIIDGAIAGSEAVQVMSVQSNGTSVLVYDNIINEDGGFNLLGSNTLTGNICTVALNRPLIKNEAICAYIYDFGQNCGGAIIVGDTGTIPTGWKIPTEVIVNGGAPITADAYETLTGLTLPNVYEPQTRNVTPNFPNSGIEQLLTIGFDINRLANAASVVLEVTNIQNCSTGFLVKFDADPVGMYTTKTYLTGTLATVRVLDPNNPLRFHQRTIAIDVPVPPPPSSAISNASYVDQKAGNLSIINIIADSALALEAQVDGVFTWLPMVFKGANRWEKDYGVPAGPGTYTVRIRVISNISDAISFSAVLT